MFVEPLRLGEGVLQGSPGGVGTDVLRLMGWAPGSVEGPAAVQTAEAFVAREMPAASNAVAKLSAELTTALPQGGRRRPPVGVGKMLSGTAKGYVPAADLLESLPSSARASLKVCDGLNFAQVAGQVQAIGMKIWEVTSVRYSRISDLARTGPRSGSARSAGEGGGHLLQYCEPGHGSPGRVLSSTERGHSACLMSTASTTVSARSSQRTRRWQGPS